MTASIERGRHISALDGLRGVAIVCVIICHANLFLGDQFPQQGISRWLAAVFGVGWVGVDLFFVLSGFLITGILCDAKGSPGFLRNFWARRALRILPLYFGYLAVIAVLGSIKFGHGTFVTPISHSDLLALAGYYYNFWYALITQKPANLAHHFWSLAVEEHFYLVWPIVVMAFSIRKLANICIIGFAASLAIRLAIVLSGCWLSIAYFITPCRLDGLLAGAFVALACRDATVLEAVRRWAGRVAMGTGGLLAGLFLGQRHFYDNVDLRRIHGPAVDSSVTLTIGISAVALLFAATLIRAVESPPNSPIQRFLNLSWLVCIGRYSYAIYVFHGLFLSLVVHAWVALVPPTLEPPDYIAKPILALLILGLSFLAAFISYHAFEKHFLRLKRYFSYNERSAPAEVESGDTLKLRSYP